MSENEKVNEMSKSKNIEFCITPDMSCEQMPNAVATAAHEAMASGQHAIATQVLSDGLDMLEACYPDDPKVMTLMSQVETIERMHRGGGLA